MNNQELLQKQMWFVNQRFGMFIHFNSATFQFAETEIEDWEYGHENHGEQRKFPFNPKDWNPVGLDCTQWARAAKAAGMKFAALTAKHHEGFSLWPTCYTEHSVKNATDKRDIVKEYLDAFRREGVIPGIYFSMLDLHHQIGRRKCNWEDKQFIKNQLKELLTNYGEVPFLIIDGWNAHWGGPHYDDLPFEEIDEWVKGIQPDCLLMNISCESTLDHTDIVFYENAAGQEIEDEFSGPGASCNILTKTWFWRKSDTNMELKDADWVLQKIEDANRHNVTFLLNGAPNQNGVLDANIVNQFENIGRRFRMPNKLTSIPDNWLHRMK
ncbi:Alpha-L-fucosidase-like protein [Paenibacillus sp. JDR-2]|nr:Alpha-L-fucosidase-like protein [Paenibacillus sp. JDR-2]